MAKELEAVVKAIQDRVLAIAGISKAPDYLPSTPPDNIFGLCAPDTGHCGGPQMGPRVAHHRIKVFIGKAHKNTSRDEEALLPFYEAFITAMLDTPTLTAPASIEGDIEHLFQWAFDYAKIAHIGWEFAVSVKIKLI